MARVSIARQQVSDAGLVPAYSPAVEEGHSVENSKGKVILHVCNTNETEATVTICSGYTMGGLKLQDRQVVIPPATCVFIGPLDQQVYNQPGTSQVWIDYSATDGVDVAALLIP